MAKTTITQITDDIDGSADAQTVQFAYDGSSYEIDLAKKNRAAFDKAMKPWLEAATKTSSRGRRSRAAAGRSGGTPGLAAVRAWATQNGYQVSDRGRLSKAVLDAYREAHRK